MNLEERIGIKLISSLYDYSSWAPYHERLLRDNYDPIVTIRYQKIEIRWCGGRVRYIHLKVPRLGLSGKLGFTTTLDLNPDTTYIPWEEVKSKLEELLSVCQARYEEYLRTDANRMRKALGSRGDKPQQDGALSVAKTEGGELSGPEVWG